MTRSPRCYYSYVKIQRLKGLWSTRLSRWLRDFSKEDIASDFIRVSSDEISIQHTAGSCETQKAAAPNPITPCMEG